MKTVDLKIRKLLTKHRIYTPNLTPYQLEHQINWKNNWKKIGWGLMSVKATVFNET